MNSLQAIAFWKALPKEKQDEIYDEMTALKNPGEPLYDGKTSSEILKQPLIDYVFNYGKEMSIFTLVNFPDEHWIIPHYIIVGFNNVINYDDDDDGDDNFIFSNITYLFRNCTNLKVKHKIAHDTVKYINNNKKIQKYHKQVNILYEEYKMLNDPIKLYE